MILRVDNADTVIRRQVLVAKQKSHGKFMSPMKCQHADVQENMEEYPAL